MQRLATSVFVCCLCGALAARAQEAPPEPPSEVIPPSPASPTETPPATEPPATVAEEADVAPQPATPAAPPNQPAPATPAATPPPPTPPRDVPNADELMLVGHVASGAAVVSLAAGIVAGLVAQQQYECVKNIEACNADRTGSSKIVGTELLDARTEFQTTALLADMGYVAAGVSAIVALTAYASAIFFPPSEEEQ